MSLQVELVEQSFRGIQPHADSFMNSFCKNLFTAYPETKPLFENKNISIQKKKLLGFLVLVVNNLRQPDVLDKVLRGLGARNIKYGTLPEHYPLVGSSLLNTFEEYLGDSWTPQVKQAWVDVYSVISPIMLDGADYSVAEIALPTFSVKEVEQIELIERSFEAIKPNADSFVNSFYKNLFAAYPEAKPLFETTDMAVPKKNLFNSLVLVVENLRMPDVLDQVLREWGAGYVKYGALPEHYPLIGNALLITFKQYLGACWTPEIKQAWIDAYGVISQIMLDGANYSAAEIALKS